MLPRFVVTITLQEFYALAARAWLMTFGLVFITSPIYFYCDYQQHKNDPVAWHKDHPTAEPQWHATEAQLTAKYGPKTEVTADGRYCPSGRCKGGYATKADYLKATGQTEDE